MQLGINFIFNYKFNAKYGLVFCATTIDWGDVQSEDYPGIFFTNSTHPAISIYSNAMMVIALQNLIEMSNGRDY